MKLFFVLVWMTVSFAGFPLLSQAANSGDVIFNEIAWMGTKANSSDEWIELKNTTNTSIDLAKWGIYKDGGSTLVVELKNSIAPRGYFLIERTDDGTIPDIAADLVVSFKDRGLGNGGEHLVLKDDTGVIIQSLNFSSGWSAGKASPEYVSMEFGNQGWETHTGSPRNGTDAEGNSIQGTPRSKNSVGEIELTSSVVAASTPTQTQSQNPTPSSTPLSIVTPSLSPSPFPVSSPVPTSTYTPTPAASQAGAAIPSFVPSTPLYQATPQVSQSATPTPFLKITSTPKPKGVSAVAQVGATSPSISAPPSLGENPEPKKEETLAVASGATAKPLILSIGTLLIVVLGTLGVLWKYVMK